jgi:hypothetical protein
MLSPARGGTPWVDSVTEQESDRFASRPALRELAGAKCETLLHTLLDQVPGNAVIVLNREHCLTVARGPMLPDFGSSGDRLVGRTLAEILPPAAITQLVPLVVQAFDGNRVTEEVQSPRHAPLAPRRGALRRPRFRNALHLA